MWAWCGHDVGMMRAWWGHEHYTRNIWFVLCFTKRKYSLSLIYGVKDFDWGKAPYWKDPLAALEWWVSARVFKYHIAFNIYTFLKKNIVSSNKMVYRSNAGASLFPQMGKNGVKITIFIQILFKIFLFFTDKRALVAIRMEYGSIFNISYYLEDPCYIQFWIFLDFLGVPEI